MPHKHDVGELNASQKTQWKIEMKKLLFFKVQQKLVCTLKSF